MPHVPPRWACLTDTLESKEMKVAEMLLEYFRGDVLDLDGLIRRDADDSIPLSIISRVGK